MPQHKKNVNKVRPLSFDEVFYAVSKNLYLQFKIAVKFTALLLSDELQNFPVLRFKIGVASSLSSMFTFQIFPKRGAGLGRRRRVRYRENHKQFIVRKRFSKLQGKQGIEIGAPCVCPLLATIEFLTRLIEIESEFSILKGGDEVLGSPSICKMGLITDGIACIHFPK